MSIDSLDSQQRTKKRLTAKEIAIIGAHAFVAWIFCTSIMMIGPLFLSMDSTLIIHAVAAPVIYFCVSFVYFSRFHFTTPLQTAFIFVGFVILIDFFVIALLILNSLEMFTSPIGTWIPFALMFATTYLTGLFVTRRVTPTASAV